MDTPDAELPEEAPVESTSLPWKLIGLIAVVAMITVGAPIIAILVARGGSSTFEAGDAIERPLGGPGGDVYVTIESGPLSTTNVAAMFGDLASDGTTNITDLDYLGRATSAFGFTDLATWKEEGRSFEDQPARLRCWGSQTTDLTGGGSGGAGCSDLGLPLVEPQISSGGTSAGAAGRPATANVTVFDAPVDARWMVVTTELGDLVVANVLNGASYAMWSQSSRGDVTSLVLLDESLSEIYFNDDFFGFTPGP